MKLMRVKNIKKTYRKNVMYCKNKNRKRQMLVSTRYLSKLI